ncbi:MAG: cytochrome c [Gammaproteobacteria bacterium]|nr:MAG: cytochrome c [Gammaproteobacteria bacterium]
MMLLRNICLTAAVLAGTGTTAVTAEATDAAEMFSAECAQCHGRTARGMASFPTLRNISAPMLAEKLTKYRAGEAIGPNSMLMFPVAENLTDEEIELLTTYIADTFN